MKQILSTLLIFTLFLFSSCKNEEKPVYDCKYYELTLPNNDWEIDKQEYPLGEGDMVSLSKTSNGVIDNEIFIIVTEFQVDPKFMLESQAVTNPEMKGADINTITDTEFNGIPAKMLPYKTDIKGVSYLLTVYCFVHSNYTYIIQEITKQGKTIDYEEQIWSSFKFKKANKTSTDGNNIESEIKQLVDGVKQLANGNLRQRVEEGLYMIDLDFDEVARCITYDYEFTDLDLDEEYIGSYRILFETDDSKRTLVDELKAMRSSTDLVDKAMKGNINFKYRYFYKNQVLGEFLITPEDYNAE